MKRASWSRAALAVISGWLLFQAPLGWSASEAARSQLTQARQFFSQGAYFKAARYAFDSSEEDGTLLPEAYALAAVSLSRAGLSNAASYFFIRTLQTGDRSAIRRVLGETESLLERVGPDLLRKYLIRHTRYEDYDPQDRSAYLYSLAKEALLRGETDKVSGYVNGIASSSPFYATGLQLRAAAAAILGQGARALADFKACQEAALSRAPGKLSSDAERRLKREGEDLRERCIAGEARTLYQMENFEAADRVYDRISKNSFVWPDILFEQAWNAFARGEYNRTLGKLVSYKSPALSFVFNTEVDVLRAQAYLGLCLYSDANEVINEFNRRYAAVGEKVKSFVESNSSSLDPFYNLGKTALQTSLSTPTDLLRVTNRFVRSPYFQGIVNAESSISAERQMVVNFDRLQPGVSHQRGVGFPGFLDQVLAWRLKTVRQLGGAFVRNSLLDHHSVLIGDFEKMAFIKLEMLGRAKEKLMGTVPSGGERMRGNQAPSRRDDQYFWSFNGEFWNDELGDYVFGLETECRS